MKKIKLFSALDYFLLVCVILLTTIGIAFIYSAGIKNGVQIDTSYAKQIIWAFCGLIILCSFVVYDYRRTQRYIFWVFIVSIVINILTALFSPSVNGSHSWIGIGPLGVQPAEFSKLIFIIFLAWYFYTSENENPRKRFFVALGILFIQVFVVLLQSDLGTALVFFPIFLFMCFTAGIKLRYTMFVLCLGLLTILFTMLPLWETYIVRENVAALRFLTDPSLRRLLVFLLASIMLIGFLGLFFYRHNKYYYWISYVSAILLASLLISPIVLKGLKQYQAKRLVSFLDPTVDPQDSAWNINQAMRAIGRGGAFGQGFMNGSYSQKQFIPEQRTDFIFSIIAEESGFIGCILIFVLYLCILLRIVHIMRTTPNKYGSYIATGIFAMFFFHFMENIGMVISLMPITGIPLLFVSYGGSSLLTSMASIGIVMAIRYRRFNFMD